MADVKWIKLCTDVFDDEKIVLIDALPERDTVLVIWLKLLCMAGKQNNGGVFMLNDKIAYTDEMLATLFRRPINTVRLALNTFEQFGMIEIINNTITIPNWEKHQSLGKLEKARDQTRKRVAKHRAKQKQLAEGNGCNALRNVTVTECNVNRKEEEKEIEIDLEKEREKDVEVVSTAAPDYDNDDDKLQIFKGKVILSERQLADLLDKLDLDAFDEYVDRLNNFLENTGATVKSHYATILKWYNEDRAVNVSVRN